MKHIIFISSRGKVASFRILNLSSRLEAWMYQTGKEDALEGRQPINCQGPYIDGYNSVPTHFRASWE